MLFGWPWWLWALIGLFVGWLIEWLWDRYWWRDRRICHEDEARLRASVSDFETRNQDLEVQLADFNVRGQKLVDFETNLNARDAELATLVSNLDGREGKLGDLEIQLNNREKELGDLSLRLDARTKELGDLDASLKAKMSDFDGRVGEFGTKEKALLALQAALATKESDLGNLSLNYQNKEAELAELAAKLDRRTDYLGEFEASLLAKEKGLTNVTDDTIRLQARIGELEATLQERELDLATVLEQSDIDLADVKASLSATGATDDAGLLARIGELEATLQERELDLATVLEQSDIDLADVKASLSATGATDDAGLLARIGELEANVQEGDLDLSTVLEHSDIELARLQTSLSEKDDALATYEARIKALEAQLADQDSFMALSTNPVKMTDVAVDNAGIAMGSFFMNGVGEPDSTIYINLAGKNIGSAVVDKSGAWSYETIVRQPAGKHDVLVSMFKDGEKLGKTKKRTVMIEGRTVDADFSEPDDLTRIHGIGPKICDLLHEHDVNTFLQLAHTDLREIMDILESGGEDFRISMQTNPETWAEQAILLHNDRTNAFNALKEDIGWTHDEDF